MHQLDLMTDLLGTPSLDTISRVNKMHSFNVGFYFHGFEFSHQYHFLLSWIQVRNEKARRYLSSMRKKQPVSFAQKFPNADPLALRLLERLLAFDPKDRPTAEEVCPCFSPTDPLLLFYQIVGLMHVNKIL